MYVTNRIRARADELIDQGAIWCDSPRDTARSADVAISMVTDRAALEAVAYGPGGLRQGS